MGRGGLRRRAAVGGRRSLEPPKIDVLGLGAQSRAIPAADGADYQLWSAWAHYQDTHTGSITMTSNIGSPMAEWVDRTLRALEPCWTEARERP